MTEIVTTGASMMATTEPHRLADQLVDSFRNVSWALDQCETAEDAKYSLLHELPPKQVVASAIDAIRQDLDGEPPLAKRLDIVGFMLEVQGLTATDEYIYYLARKLGGCSRRRTEMRERDHAWFSMATIARAIDEVLSTLRPKQGRPIPPADILDIAGRYASELIDQYESLLEIKETIARLELIADGKQLPKPDAGDDDDDVPF
jgi:hypothetical protein